jgi:hypothetical protein
MKKKMRVKSVVGSIGRIRFLVLALLTFVQATTFAAAPAETQVVANTNSYQNFDFALYCSIQDMRRLASDPQWAEESWNVLSHAIKIDKVWLETYRGGGRGEPAGGIPPVLPEDQLRKVKAFFASKGVKISGGIMAYVGKPNDRIAGFCYTNPDEREAFRKIVAYTASQFDEIIFDDLWIFNCRCELCQKAKGDLSWTDYRLKVMKEVGENLVVKNARSVNPKVRLIFKPPNWYEAYQFSGFNLDAQPKAFDMIYAGTETRDGENNNMHLQPYQSYGIMRFFEHIKPGKFGGGWVDPGQRQTINRYTEQIEDTLFAKPKEITHWSYGNLLETLRRADGSTNVTSILALAAGDACEKVDAFLGKLGEPFGVATYKPYNSSGEMYLHHYFGMIGVPMDIFPEFPDQAGTVFLTESAKFDPDIVSKIWKHLNADKKVIITSGLLKALQGKGIEKIVEVEYTGRTVPVSKFSFREAMDGEPSSIYSSDSEIPMPELAYGLVDAEEIAQGVYKDNNRYSLLMGVRGLLKGKFYILTIPESFDDLYHLPQPILSQIRRDMMGDIPVYLDSPAKVCLFTYANNTFIAKSYLPYAARGSIVIKKAGAKLTNLVTGREERGYTKGDTTVFDVVHQPRTYNVYRFE